MAPLAKENCILEPSTLQLFPFNLFSFYANLVR